MFFVPRIEALEKKLFDSLQADELFDSLAKNLPLPAYIFCGERQGEGLHLEFFKDFKRPLPRSLPHAERGGGKAF